MPDIDAVLAAQGFAGAGPVAGEPSIAHIGREQRCGLYCLHFTDGAFYVGKALDVVSRYRQHRQTWDDIARISFKRVPVENLARQEEALIKLLEREGFALRNIVFTTPGQSPFGMADFDSLMPAENQQRWLSDLTYIDRTGPRLVDETHRARYSRKYQRFLQQPHADDIIQVLRDYVQQGIPAYIVGERTFWVCTTPFQKISPGHIAPARININWQEVMGVYLDKGKPIFSFYLARSAIRQSNRLRDLAFKFRWLWRGAWPTWHQYKPGGQDQYNFEVDTIEGARALLADPVMLSAIREFNMRLIRQGPTAFSKFHSYDLADRLLEE